MAVGTWESMADGGVYLRVCEYYFVIRSGSLYMLICYAMNWAWGQQTWRARDTRKIAWEMCNFMGGKSDPSYG